MKLLFCEVCGSAFSLAIQKVKTCDCGLVSGMYVNNRQAITNGEGTAIGMGTGSLHHAIVNVKLEGDKHERSHYIDSANITCWARPHSGIGNPHTSVVKDKKKILVHSLPINQLVKLREILSGVVESKDRFLGFKTSELLELKELVEEKVKGGKDE